MGAYGIIYYLYFLNDALMSSDCRTVRLQSNKLEIMEKELLYQQIHTEYLKSSSSSSSQTSRIGPFDLFCLQSYSCLRQRFFGLPIVLLPCGL